MVAACQTVLSRSSSLSLAFQVDLTITAHLSNDFLTPSKTCPIAAPLCPLLPQAVLLPQMLTPLAMVLRAEAEYENPWALHSSTSGA